ncbi:hypothetical protein [Aeromonas enteropelogenes]|uniref:hypothetical protein n=1 Tax=Aeromonas enteropelogenes TaxID=29489 RepID=UPI001CBD465E|nr:hypothetical protein [Aeromonas enteropelogenes]UAK70948.1 hypothetical protein K8O95_14875 [Aeromonas enteropelogenes]
MNKKTAARLCALAALPLVLSACSIVKVEATTAQVKTTANSITAGMLELKESLSRKPADTSEQPAEQATE